MGCKPRRGSVAPTCCINQDAQTTRWARKRLLPGERRARRVDASRAIECESSALQMVVGSWSPCSSLSQVRNWRKARGREGTVADGGFSLNPLPGVRSKPGLGAIGRMAHPKAPGIQIGDRQSLCSELRQAMQDGGKP